MEASASFQLYPASSYAWQVFRREWVQPNAQWRPKRASVLRKRWPAWMKSLRERRYSKLPRRFRQPRHWNALLKSLECFHDTLLDNNGLFFADTATVPEMGSGVFAAQHLGPGDYVDLMGECHKISLSQKATLSTRCGETSFCLAQPGRSKQMEYLSGPLSLVNHACPPANNAKFISWKDDPRLGHKRLGIRLIRPLRPGDEVLADYGTDWKEGQGDGFECKCSVCVASKHHPL